jgi:monovalent cation/hydrogen antiporter
MGNQNTVNCQHLADINLSALNRGITQCEECGVSAPTRVCMTCGHVGCCESTRGHARAHSLEAGHPLIRELPNSSDSFTWCYQCNAYISI